MEKVGLILEGGGMRGVFTAGVLDYFLDLGIHFDEIIGVSAGACHACSFVSKQRGRAKDITLDYINDRRYCSLFSLITTGDLFGAKFLYDTIPNQLNIFDDETFINSDSKLFATVTNIETGLPEYLPLIDMRNDIEALRASASLPLVSNIVLINGAKYLDGGVSDSIPILKIESDGYSKNIIVLTQPIEYRKNKSSMATLMKFIYKKYPNLIKTMNNRHQLYNDTLDYINEQERKGNVLVIRPQEKLEVGRIEKNKDKLQHVYDIGYQQALAQKDKILKFLNL